MTRIFVETPTFQKRWAQMGLTDRELRSLEELLLRDPKAGDVIPGLQGARKVRLGLATHGKSGGIRVIYVDVVVERRIYLITAYPKGVQTDLTPGQKRSVRNDVKDLKEE